MNFFKNSVLVIFLTQIFSTVSFAVLYSSLTLYLTGALNFSASQAYAMVTVFMVYNYGIHLLGSYLGGRLASYRVLFIIAMCFKIVGCLILAGGNESSLYLGLTIFLVATGINLPCLNMMLTQRLQVNHVRRERAFLWNYSGSNIGFFFGLTAAGYFQLQHNYSQLFLIAAGFNIIAIVIVILGWQSIADQNTVLIDALKEKGSKVLVKKYLYLFVIFLVLLGIIYISLKHPFSLKKIVLLVSVIFFVFYYWLSTRQEIALDKQKIRVYLVLSVFGLLFWSMYYLAPMALTIFAEHNVNMHLFGVKLTPQWLGNINVVMITLGGFILPPVFALIRRKTPLTVPIQFAIGILCIGVGLIFLPIGISLANSSGQSSVLWVSLFYVFQSLGELMIAPIGYSMIAQVSPLKHQGLMMGTWMLITGSTASVISSYFSGSVQVASGSNLASVTNHNYSVLFSILAFIAICLAIALILIAKKLNPVIESSSLISAKTSES